MNVEWSFHSGKPEQGDDCAGRRAIGSPHRRSRALVGSRGRSCGSGRLVVVLVDLLEILPGNAVGPTASAPITCKRVSGERPVHGQSHRDLDTAGTDHYDLRDLCKPTSPAPPAPRARGRAPAQSSCSSWTSTSAMTEASQAKPRCVQRMATARSRSCRQPLAERGWMTPSRGLHRAIVGTGGL